MDRNLIFLGFFLSISGQSRGIESSIISLTRRDAVEDVFVPCDDRENDFFCDHDEKCIVMAKKCDGHEDCSDGQDERSCNQNVCGEDSFKCATGNTCVPKIWKCDGQFDCVDRSDEQNCNRAIKVHACLDTEFACNSTGLCLPSGWKCDGNEDCTDGSDELDAVCHDRKCLDDMFDCGNFHCIPKRWLCDGRNDCPNGADEGGSCQVSCEASEGKFRCENHRFCLNATSVCDEKDDCGDNSDEGAFCKSACKPNTCHHDCLPTSHGEFCYCQPGYNLTIGGSCEDIDECKTYGICSQDCHNTPGSYKCTCRNGYKMELGTGSCVAFHEPTLLVFSTRSDVRAIEMNNGFTQKFSVVRDVHQFNIGEAIGVAFDSQDGRVYWTAIKNKKEGIMSALLDGTEEAEYLVSDGLDKPEGIAIDHIGRNVYFTDPHLHMVGVANIRSKHWTPLITKGLEQPRAIALFPEKGLMFISDWGEAHPRIIRAHMDGSDVRTLVNADMKWPNGVAIDKVQERVYWSDADHDVIESVKLDGTDRRKVLVDIIHHPFSVAVFEDTIYWSDWKLKEIQSCNKYTGKNLTTIVKEPLIDPMGISIYHRLLESQHYENPCPPNRCSHICLLAPLGKFSCHCPNNGRLHADLLTCDVPKSRALDSENIFKTVTAASTSTSTVSTANNEKKAIFNEAVGIFSRTDYLSNGRFLSNFSRHSNHDENHDDQLEKLSIRNDDLSEDASVKNHYILSEIARIKSEKLIVGIVVTLLLLLLIAMLVYCFIRRRREKKSTISLHFRNSSFRRARIGSCGEELKDVSIEPKGKNLGDVNELHNPIFMPLHSSASNQDIYKGWSHVSLSPKIKRSLTQPDFDCSSTSTPALVHGGHRSYTLDSQKSDVSRSDSAFVTGSTPPLQSSMDEDDGDTQSLGNYEDTEQLLP